MRKQIGRIFGLSSALLLLATTAQAQEREQGHGHGHDKDKNRGGVVRNDGRREHDDERDDDRDEDHDEQGEGRRNRRVNGQIVNGQVVTVDPRRGTVVTGDPRRQGTVTPNGDPRRSSTGVYRRDEEYQDGRKVPPGLAKKPGGMPPGQYKKIYGTNQGADVLGSVMRRRGYTVVRTEPYGPSQYVYYRLGNGTVQRAIVSPGTERLQFTNVPAALLNEVLSRLY